LILVCLLQCISYLLHEIIHFMQTKVDISKDSIYVNGNRISKKLPPKLYFAVNKPKGSVSYFDLMTISWCNDYLAFLGEIPLEKRNHHFKYVVSMFYRYICSCGEESKSVVSLFNDYLKGWVCSTTRLCILFKTINSLVDAPFLSKNNIFCQFLCIFTEQDPTRAAKTTFVYCGPP
jgi:hypothetical protein